MRVLTVFLIGIVSLAGCRPSTPTTASPEAESSAVESSGEGGSEAGATGTVTFQIKQGEELTTFEIEDVPEGATLESVMRRIDQIPISIRGSGVTAFVDQIGETATSSSEGWTYEIDGEFATRGIGDTTLSPPAIVEWSFGSMTEP